MPPDQPKPNPAYWIMTCAAELARVATPGTLAWDAARQASVALAALESEIKRAEGEAASLRDRLENTPRASLPVAKTEQGSDTGDAQDPGAPPMSGAPPSRPRPVKPQRPASPGSAPGPGPGANQGEGGAG
jgi:hypothetical protein